MPIDPRIALQARPATFDVGEALKLREMADRRRMQERIAAAQFAMQAERLGMERAQFDREQGAFAKAEKDKAMVQEAMSLSGGDAKKAAALVEPENFQAANALRQFDYDKTAKELDAYEKQATFIGQTLGSAKDEASYQQALGTLRAAGVDIGQMKPSYDPAVVESYQRKGLTITQQITENRAKLEDQRKAAQDKRAEAEENRKAEEFGATLLGKKADSEKKKVDAKIAGMQAEFMEKDPGTLKPNERATADAAAARIREGIESRKQRAADAAAGRAVTMRGQNMADTRAREKAEKAKDEKPPTSAERRAAGYLIRAQGAAEAIKDMEDDMAEKGLFSQAWYSYAPNFLQSDLNQAYRDAQREFTEARLRKDSGAAIPPAEFENDAKTYFPQPGDSANTLRVKAEARNRVLRALRLESGRAAAEADVAAGAGIEESGPKVGTVEDGYRFKGGDPSKPDNWEKVR